MFMRHNGEIRLQGVTYGRLREDSDTEAGNHSAEQNGATSDSGGGGHGDHDEFDFSEIAVHQVIAADSKRPIAVRLQLCRRALKG